jgi:hypothetical protein
MRCLFEKWRWLARMEKQPPAEPSNSHLESCPGCRAFTSASRRLEQALKKTQPVPAPSPGFHQRVMISVRNAAERPPSVRATNAFPGAFRLRIVLAGTAAAAVIALMVFVARPPVTIETAAPPPMVEADWLDPNAFLLAVAQAQSVAEPIETEFDLLRADIRRATSFTLGQLSGFAALPENERK